MLQTAIEAARKAGRLIVDRYPGERVLAMKGRRDLVTDVDTGAEAVILEEIGKRFPGHAVLSEESLGGAIGPGYTWVVDPLDGTTNYAHRHPVFAVSIGLLKGGEPVAGVVFDPLRNQLFAAEKGCGAMLDGVRIQTSTVSDLADTLLAFDWGHSDEMRARMLHRLGRVLPRCGTMRSLGSAALALAYVAAGRLDGYFHAGLKPWDAAAGMLLVKEAGGSCTTLEGEPYRVESSGCLATNRLVHDALLGILKSGGDRRRR